MKKANFKKKAKKLEKMAAVINSLSSTEKSSDYSDIDGGHLLKGLY